MGRSGKVSRGDIKGVLVESVNLGKKIKKLFSQKITFICITPTPRGPVRVNFSLAFIVFMLGLWTIFTAAAVYFNSKHIDYWSAKIKSLVLRTKYEYVNQQLSKSWELLSQVQQNDEQLRKLLEMKSRKVIITSVDNANQGGPTLQESQLLQKISVSPENVSIIEYSQHLSTLKEQLEQQIKSYKEIIETIEYQRDLYRNTPLGWPCEGNVTSPFGYRVHPITKQPDFHSGLDVANNRGTPIKVTADGVIKYAGWQQNYGQVIVVEHKYGFRTVYAHLSLIKVKVGQKVKRGNVIGLMGDTGSSTGPHVHYEVWKNDSLQNPIRYVDPEKFFKN